MSAAENLDHLERQVEVACQAIYAQRDGYWPTEHERHNIAIALVAVDEDVDLWTALDIRVAIGRLEHALRGVGSARASPEEATM